MTVEKKTDASEVNGSAELAERAQMITDQRGHQKALNRLITICWTIIVCTFTFFYILEVVKGLRTVPYLLAFEASMILPLAVCAVHFHRAPDDPRYGVWVCLGYFIMYVFSMLTGDTTMVFSYILPMLSFMVLLHRPRVIALGGFASLLVNLLAIGLRWRSGAIDLTGSRDVEIQLALIIFCFTGAWLSSRLYASITASYENALDFALQQQNQIHGLENVVLVDNLTGLGNRAAYEQALDRIREGIEESGKEVGVIFCDANGLKYRNDNMGHQAGDQLLKDIADRLRRHFRPSDCFRISGDEFVILIPNLEQYVFSVRAQRFHDDIWGMDVPPVSVGWDISGDVAESVKNAEIRMYADKKDFYAKYPLYKRS